MSWSAAYRYHESFGGPAQDSRYALVAGLEPALDDYVRSWPFIHACQCVLVAEHAACLSASSSPLGSCPICRRRRQRPQVGAAARVGPISAAIPGCAPPRCVATGRCSHLLRRTDGRARRASFPVAVRRFPSRSRREFRVRIAHAGGSPLGTERVDGRGARDVRRATVVSHCSRNSTKCLRSEVWLQPHRLVPEMFWMEARHIVRPMRAGDARFVRSRTVARPLLWYSVFS